MAVSQRFIDLLNMPMPALRKLAKDREADLPPGGAAGKWDLAKAVARTGTRDELEADSDGFLYAGSTAMSWFRLVPEDVVEEDEDNQIVAAEFYPLDAPPLDLETVKAALVNHAEGDPFDEEDRPAEITAKPKLILAREWRDGILMTFALAKRLTTVIHNFEEIEVLEDEFFPAFLRLADGTFEVRASYARADRLESAWLDEFAEELGRIALSVQITEADVRAVRDQIGGRVAKFDGSESTGTSAIGTVTYGKSDTCNDLFEEEEFTDAVKGYDSVGYDMLFDHQDTTDARMHISTQRGSVFIRTAVPETTVRYIYDAIRAAKGS